MFRISRPTALALAAGALLAAIPARAAAQSAVVWDDCAPRVSYYPAPRVAYYEAPRVAYYEAPAMSYYAPRVSYYAAPVVTYAPPAVSYAPAAVTVTRYGLFGRPRETVTYYPR